MTTTDHTGSMPNYERRDRVRAMYEKGMTIRAIAAEVGVTFQAVHAMLVRTGVAMRKRGGNMGSHSRHK